MINAVDG